MDTSVHLHHLSSCTPLLNHCTPPKGPFVRQSSLSPVPAVTLEPRRWMPPKWGNTFQWPGMWGMSRLMSRYVSCRSPSILLFPFHEGVSPLNLRCTMVYPTSWLCKSALDFKTTRPGRHSTRPWSCCSRRVVPPRRTPPS